jgi:hypothetical protein
MESSHARPAFNHRLPRLSRIFLEIIPLTKKDHLRKLSPFAVHPINTTKESRSEGNQTHRRTSSYAPPAFPGCSGSVDTVGAAETLRKSISSLEMRERECPMNNQTASEQIGSFIASTRPALASDEVVHQAARAFVDIFGVAAAGRNEPASRIILDYVTS